MIKWLKSYYTRKDTRWGFMCEDMRINLISAGVVLAFYAGYNLYLNREDKRKTNNHVIESIFKNDELMNYINKKD